MGYPASGFRLRKAMNDICAAAGFTPQVARESNADQALLCLVAAGAGISILPRELSSQGDVSGVVFKTIDDTAVQVRHGIAWLEQNQNPALLNLLAEVPALIGTTLNTP